MDENLYHLVVYSRVPSNMEFPLSRQTLIPLNAIGRGSSGKIYSLIDKYTKKISNYIIKFMDVSSDLSIYTLVSNTSNLDRETIIQNFLYHKSKSFTDIIPFAYPITYIFIKADDTINLKTEEAPKEAGVIMEKCHYTFSRIIRLVQSKRNLDTFLELVYFFIDKELPSVYNKMSKEFGFKHNDLHINNIMMNIDNDGSISFKIIDFGLSVIKTESVEIDNSSSLRNFMFGKGDSSILFTSYPDTDIVLLLLSLLNHLQKYEDDLIEDKTNIHSSEESYDEINTSLESTRKWIDKFCELLENKTKLYKTSKMITDGILTDLSYPDESIKSLLGSIDFVIIPVIQNSESLVEYYKKITKHWNINNWRNLSYVSLATNKIE